MIDGAFDTVLVRYIHNNGDDLTPSRTNLVWRSVDAGTLFQDFLTSSGDVNFGSICGQCLCVHLLHGLVGGCVRMMG